MIAISRSLGRKLGATFTVATAFVLMYEAKVMDFHYVALPGVSRDVTADELPLPARATNLRFTATAYCKGTTTASGVRVRTGVAAADPQLLPVGSVVQVAVGDSTYSGVCAGLLGVGALILTMRSWRSANRMLRERQQEPSRKPR